MNPKNAKNVLFAKKLEANAKKVFERSQIFLKEPPHATPREGTKIYIKYRTTAELRNSKLLLANAFVFFKSRKLTLAEKKVIVMLTHKVKEYPERNNSRAEIIFSKKEIEIAKKVGKVNLLKAKYNLGKIDAIISQHINVRGQTFEGENFPNHFLWHGLAHANRLIGALIHKLN